MSEVLKPLSILSGGEWYVIDTNYRAYTVNETSLSSIDKTPIAAIYKLPDGKLVWMSDELLDFCFERWMKTKKGVETCLPTQLKKTGGKSS